MNAIRVMPRPTRAATFHAMALARWREAVARKMAGDEQGYLDGLRDVRALDEQAALARAREERLRVQIEERRQMAQTLDHILAIAQAGQETP